MLGIAAVAGVWADRLYSEPNIEGHGVAKAWCTVLACQVAAVLPPPCRARAAQVKVLHRIGLYSKLVLCSPVLASQFQWNAWIVHSTVPPVWWWAEALAAMESWLWSENSSLASAEPAESGPVLESHHRQRYQTFLSCFLCSFPSSGTAYSTNSMPLSLCISWISCTAGLCGIYPAYIYIYRFSMFFHRCSSLPVQLLAQCPSLHQNEQHGTWAEVMQCGASVRYVRGNGKAQRNALALKSTSW